MHKDLTQQIDRVRRVMNDEAIPAVYQTGGYAAEHMHIDDLRDIAYACVERIDQEREANNRCRLCNSLDTR